MSYRKEWYRGFGCLMCRRHYCGHSQGSSYAAVRLAYLLCEPFEDDFGDWIVGVYRHVLFSLS